MYVYICICMYIYIHIYINIADLFRLVLLGSSPRHLPLLPRLPPPPTNFGLQLRQGAPKEPSTLKLESGGEQVAINQRNAKLEDGAWLDCILWQDSVPPLLCSRDTTPCRTTGVTLRICCCRANMARIRQSGPGFDLGF